PSSALAAAVSTVAVHVLSQRKLAWGILAEPVDVDVTASRLASRRDIVGEIASRIDAAVRAGHLPAQDTQLAATALLGALHEALVGPLAPDHLDDPAKLRDTVQAVTLLALRAVGVMDARARGLAKRINTPLAIVDKRRERPGESEVMNVIGDVSGRTCILIDDIVDSGGTLVNAADALLKHGAKDVYAYITHGVLSGGAATRITSSRLKELVITDSIMPTEAVRNAPNIRALPIAPLIAEAIGRTAAEESVSSLFD
ncbi:MAG: ribose-phosphate diphosphokinase, partial [Bradyrhizobium sp.]|nr:ribose-phosphate diphosphokinase [Bradyrhizobium sp.]